MNVKTAGDVEIRMLEELLNAEPPKCESRHVSQDNAECSRIATHKQLHQCRHSFLICEMNAPRNLRLLENPIGVCQCGRFKSECWRVVPI